VVVGDVERWPSRSTVTDDDTALPPSAPVHHRSSPETASMAKTLQSVPARPDVVMNTWSSASVVNTAPISMPAWTWKVGSRSVNGSSSDPVSEFRLSRWMAGQPAGAYQPDSAAAPDVVAVPSVGPISLVGVEAVLRSLHAVASRRNATRREIRSIRVSMTLVGASEGAVARSAPAGLTRDVIPAGAATRPR
jgi:hypothetical protein